MRTGEYFCSWRDKTPIQGPRGSPGRETDSRDRERIRFLGTLCASDTTVPLQLAPRLAKSERGSAYVNAW